ncbi:hypothetical protein [Leptospira fainei]|nr:hypothetical protein [Leptospira fainei]
MKNSFHTSNCSSGNKTGYLHTSDPWNAIPVGDAPQKNESIHPNLIRLRIQKE